MDENLKMESFLRYQEECQPKIEKELKKIKADSQFIQDYGVEYFNHMGQVMTDEAFSEFSAIFYKPIAFLFGSGIPYDAALAMVLGILLNMPKEVFEEERDKILKEKD